MTYSADFRKHILTVKHEEKLTYAATAERFRIGTTTLVRWEQGFIPQFHRHRQPNKLNLEALLKDVEEHPDAFQSERAERLGVASRTIGRGLQRLRITRKKRVSTTQKPIRSDERSFSAR